MTKFFFKLQIENFFYFKHFFFIRSLSFVNVHAYIYISSRQYDTPDHFCYPFYSYFTKNNETSRIIGIIASIIKIFVCFSSIGSNNSYIFSSVILFSPSNPYCRRVVGILHVMDGIYFVNVFVVILVLSS